MPAPSAPTADQLLARLYALRKDYADDPEDETYIALHHSFLFISYHMNEFKDYVRDQVKPTGDAHHDGAETPPMSPPGEDYNG